MPLPCVKEMDRRPENRRVVGRVVPGEHGCPCQGLSPGEADQAMCAHDPLDLRNGSIVLKLEFNFRE